MTSGEPIENEHVDDSLPLLYKHVDHTATQQPTAAAVETHEDVRRSRSENFGYLMILLGAVCFSCHAFLIRLSESVFHVPSRITLYIRGAIHTVLSILYFILAYTPSDLFTWTLGKNQVTLLFFRGLSGTISLLLFYTGVNMVQVGDAISVYFLNPIFTFLLAGFFLSEDLTIQGFIAAVLSSVGTILIAIGQYQDVHTDVATQLTTRIIGISFIFIGAFLAAVAYTIIRALGTSISFMSSVMTFGLFCLGTGIVFNDFRIFPAVEISTFDRHGVLAAVAAGLASFIAQCGLNLGLQRCKAGPGILITNIEVPIVFTLAALFLNEYPTLISIFGSALIVSSAIVIGFVRIKRQRVQS